ncbi:tyrosine-type recombinase/integrase [Marinobacter qingdaonensis]|uniref:Tyrosine-type recombinase/integrase n=1 Tax=Marinobacter qingdaonensis TaxID=3108486 RepID=A0ABU5NYK0_9GAMM|nr:tyrosine-type recombinase/integrase [Marinobacter sp. ASW11-75]MEA1080874.1 tyrosine-type recombinase/integrase [Marinobacter sp. ASW11-75]
MTTATKKRTSTFNEKAKKGLAPGEEISESGIIYRKRKDGFGTWRYDFTQSGTRHKGVIGSDRDGVTLSQARDVISELRAKAITDRISGRTGRSTQSSRPFREVANEYLDWSETHHQDHRHNVSRMNNHLLPRFGDRRLGDITTAMIETMRTELRRAKVSAQTIQRIVSLLSCTFDFAQKSDPNLDNPTTRLSRVKHQKKEVVPFTREETDALLNTGAIQYNTVTRGPDKGKKTENKAKTAEFRVIIGLALFAGLRASEALGLTWENVDLEQGLIRIDQVAKEGTIRDSTKTYKPRMVPITSSLKPLLEDLRQHHVEGQRENGLLLSRNGVAPYNQIQVMFGRMKKRAGITSDKGYHALRHTFATRASEKNIDLKTIQKWLGHASISTTMIYVHSTEEHLEAAAKLLD